jgi:hypothetical protein
LARGWLKKHGITYFSTSTTPWRNTVYSPSPKRDRPSSAERSQRSRSPKSRRNDTAIAKKLLGPLPISETGQRLANLFPNGWDWIYTDRPKRGNKPEWETIKKYPLAPIELWSLHQDEQCIIGIRPDKDTRWGILDIDITSPYHPINDPEALPKIQSTLEDIGIVRALLSQSSHSGGLHLYLPLPETISSYGLAVALKLHLSAAGFKLRSGQLEIFPNVKRYIPQGFSLYNGVRLPFQPNTGFIPLDDDLTPLPWNLEDWLNAFDLASSCQDIPLLKRQIADAKLNHRIRSGDRTPQSLESWQERITQEKQGWSGPGQTNEKLKAIACEARVFMGMDSEDQLAAHIEQTAQATPGFSEHSNHQKDLKQRSRDIASWAMKYYWPLGGPASRDTGYHSPQKSIADLSYHRAKREAAQHRIREAIAQLQQTNALPATATARAKAIVSIAKVSQHTLYKNKPLWHPEEFPALAPAKQTEPHTQQEITQQAQKTDQNEKTKAPQPLSNKRITQLLYKVGFVINGIWLEALEALAPKGQSASPKALVVTELEERGESEGGNALISGWSELRRSLPEALQEKIAQAERARQRQDELEQKRRERVAKRRQLRVVDTSAEAFAQLELEIAQQFEGEWADGGRTLGAELSFLASEAKAEYEVLPSQIGSAPDRLQFVEQPIVGFPAIVPGRDAEDGREPHAWEQQEFEQWYGLAVGFGLVEDFFWDGLQYWVSRGEQVWTFSEMVGVFTVGWMRSRLGERGSS